MSSDDAPEAAEEFAQPPAVTASGQIEPSDCGCGCGGKGKKNGGEEHKDCGCGCGGKGGEAKKPQLVYALGKLGYDFGTEARRDSLAQAMTGERNNPLLPDQSARLSRRQPLRRLLGDLDAQSRRDADLRHPADGAVRGRRLYAPARGAEGAAATRASS